MKMLLTSLTVLLAATAFGKSSNEYFFQPAAGASALDLTYTTGSWTSKDLTDVETKVTQGDINLDYAYGLNANTALGLYTFTGTLESKTSGVTTKADGMGDLHAYYKGFSDVWHYGVDLGLSTAKAATDKRSSGGMSLTGNVGGLWTDASWNYGANLAYSFLMERTWDTTPEIKVTEGNTMRLAGFGEYNYGSGFVGAELSSTTVNDSKAKVSGLTTTVKGQNFMAIKAYGTYGFSEMVDGLLSIEDQMHPKVAANNVKAYSEMLIELGVRLNF